MTELEFARGQKPSEDRLLEVMREISVFIDSQIGYSYYDLKKYVYENDLYEWIICLRKPKYRQFLSAYLNDKHKDEKTKYKSNYPDAYLAAEGAKVDFYERHNFDELLIEELENNTLNE